jgi:hypothetical protein
MSQVQSGVPDTDVSRPSALPSANLQRTGAQGVQQPIAAQNSAEYLDAIEEEWNKKVDAEVDILVDGMVDLVSLASVSSFLFVCLLPMHALIFNATTLDRREG